MNLRLLPKTKYGKWSIGLLFACLLFFKGFQYVGSIYGNSDGAGFITKPWLVILIALAWLTGYSAFFTGILAFIKKDRSLLVLISAAAGLLFFIYGVIKLLAPP